MNIAEAWSRLAVAGRELGSGPAEAARRFGLNDVADFLMERGVEENRAQAIGLGAALGRIIAEDPDALAALDAIHKEWRSRS